jgi:F-type H+-transporting ATPase subunit a
VANPIEQFKIQPLVPLKIAGLDVSFTNSAAMMVLAVVLATAFLTLSVRSRALVPGRWQSLAEIFYEFIAGMLRDNVGSEGRRYFPFIFTLFMFVLFGNVLGLLPIPEIGFTYTSHIIVTFAIAAVVFIGVTVIGFARHGFHFLRMFFPEGAPIATALVLVPIEIISYLSRPISLSVRLFANMTAGHIILKIMGGFTVTLGAMYVLPGVLPFAFLSAVTVLEIGIALLQAYVFTVLTCIYLHDAIHMH